MLASQEAKARETEEKKRKAFVDAQAKAEQAKRDQEEALKKSENEAARRKQEQEAIALKAATLARKREEEEIESAAAVRQSVSTSSGVRRGVLSDSTTPSAIAAAQPLIDLVYVCVARKRRICTSAYTDFAPQPRKSKLK